MQGGHVSVLLRFLDVVLPVQAPSDGGMAPEEQPPSSFQLPPPASDAQVRRAVLRGGRLALLWSNGTLQTYSVGASSSGTQQTSAAAPQPALGVSLPLKGFALTAPQVCPLPPLKEGGRNF